MPGILGWPFFEGPRCGRCASNYFDYYKYTEINGVVGPINRSNIYATTDQVNDALAVITADTAANRPYFVN